MSTDIHKHKILILDFGSQYTQLIARRIREIGVYCELWAWDVADHKIQEFAPNGIILSGGPESVTEAGSPRAPEYVFNAGVPVLGICYGMQTMAEQLGGRVAGSSEREFGYAQVELQGVSKLFKDIEDHVSEQGNGFVNIRCRKLRSNSENRPGPVFGSRQMSSHFNPRYSDRTRERGRRK